MGTNAFNSAICKQRRSSPKFAMSLISAMKEGGSLIAVRAACLSNEKLYCISHQYMKDSIAADTFHLFSFS